MKKRYVVILVLLILSLLIFFNQNFPPVRFIALSVQSIFSLPRVAIYNLKTQFAPDDSVQIKSSKAANERLVKQVTDFERLKADNQALRDQFETSLTVQYNLLPAKVLGFGGPFSLPTSLIIDQGERSGVARGMAVVLGSNLVGRVDKVSASYSKVSLPLNESFSTLAKTSENGSLGVVKGLDDFILLDRVAIKDKVVNGETVMTKGDVNDRGIGIPADFIVGRVVAIARNENLPFQTAKIQSPLPFARLTTVFVIKGFK